VLILWRRLNVDSGGAGQLRGGQGLDSAWILWGGGEHSCFSFQSCCEVPGRGFAGGYPGGAGFNHLVRDSNIRELIDRGEIPLQASDLKGRFDPMPGKGSNIPFRVDDVYYGMSSGGGGLGDPFLRDPARVQQDVLEGRVHREVAEGIYGAVFGDDGRVDHDATWAARDQVRAERVPSKRHSLASEGALPGQFGAVPCEGHWTCAHCRAAIAPLATPWKEVLAPERSALVQVFQKSGQFVRARDEKAVIFAERFCGDCGTLLSTDLEVEGEERKPSTFAFDAGAARGAH
jgi:N-methylhydantoinase B